MTSPFDLIIFDCDGVLVDSERLAVRIEVEILADLGWELTEADIVERFVGRSHEYMTAEVSRHIGRELALDWDDAYTPLYRAAFEEELTPVAGIVEALDAIAAASLPTCVASSGSHDKMRITLGLTDLYERFEGRIYSASEVSKGKPAPDLFLHAASRMGSQPERCAVVEDSAPGVEAGLAAGMSVFAFGGGVTAPDKVALLGSTLFMSMSDLPALLKTP